MGGGFQKFGNTGKKGLRVLFPRVEWVNWVALRKS